jgi:putative ABC transport system permease protein
VQSVAVVRPLPFTNDGWESVIRIAGRPALDSDEKQITDLAIVIPAYFRTMQIPLLRGRFFTDRDSAGAPWVTIINEAAARRFFPGQDPVGRKIQLGGDKEPWVTVVGVVGNVKLFGLASIAPPICYASNSQAFSHVMTFVLRTASDPLSLSSAVHRAVLEVDPEQPVFGINTMEHLVASSITRERFSVWLLCAFACIACVLACVGIYGVLSYAVSQRTHEIGVRMALGAGPQEVMRLVVGQGMLLTLAGVALGLAAAFGLTRFLGSMLYGVAPADLPTFASVSIVLATAALLACYVPARRATRVDPMDALR